MTKAFAALIVFLALAATGWCADDKLKYCQESMCDGHARAGCPQCISPLARPGITPYYDGYYVGGGVAVAGQCKCPQEGTWGWDYVGILPKRVALNWWHGAHAQGSGGAYATNHTPFANEK